MTKRKMRVGDWLTFKAATRKIVSIDHSGRPLVRYAGWHDFIVQPNEIISVEKRP